MTALPAQNLLVVGARRSATLLAIATASLLAACGGGGGSGDTGSRNTSSAPPATNTFSGAVTFQGVPLAGVTVVAFNTNTNSTFATTTTDSAGRYSFAGLGTSCNCTLNYQFWARKTGYSFSPAIGANATTDRSGYQWQSAGSVWFADSGAAVSRQDYTGQFSNPGGGSAFIQTVLNFDSLANGSVSNGDFIAHDGSAPLVRLAATGQSQSYAVGDDADLHAGVAAPTTRWVDHHDGTVSDTLTGLVWLKDAGCLATAAWTAALASANHLASGACGLSDGSTAGQWRLPNQWELESIVDASATAPAIAAGQPFANVSATPYWTSTSYYGGQAGSPSAWAIRLSDGRYINDGVANAKTAPLAVWAVKGDGSGGAVKLQATGTYVPYAAGDDGSVQAGVALPFPRMRDNGDGTVTDTLTGLVWLRQANCLRGDWPSTVAAVRGLASGQCGLTDGSSAGAWRMPNRKEMASLADRALNNQADFLNTAWTTTETGIAASPAVFTQFVAFEYYWTSTTDAADPASAWTVFSCDDGIYDTAKTATGYTLAVRD